MGGVDGGGAGRSDRFNYSLLKTVLGNAFLIWPKPINLVLTFIKEIKFTVKYI